MKALKRLAEASAGFIDRASGGRLTPNIITATGLALHLPVGWLIIAGQPLYAGLALLIAAPLDALDGALARRQNRATDFGVWFDAVSDRLKEVIVFSSLAYHLAASGRSGYLIGLCTAALGLSLAVSYVKAKSEAVLAARGKKLAPAKLNRLFGGGYFSYEWRVALVILILISQQFAIGLGILVAGSCLTIWQRSADIKKAIRR
ncbi:CDP-alcohol phosphatidyltransferase family protein [Candidatus Saccharibacteria bacterium]|nr:CDP-alcohol phosphatidyltransferase family protein [Candidatus Saccharibacteria bacterium]